MAITAKITNLVHDDRSKIKAYAKVTIDDMFTVCGVKVAQGENELFVSMPSYQSKDEHGNTKYVEIFHPNSKEFKEMLSSAVLGAYELSLSLHSHEEEQQSQTLQQI